MSENPSMTRNVSGVQLVQADNAPDCGVAQGVNHGVTVRHGEKQEEEEGEVEQEVEREQRRRQIKHQCAWPMMRWNDKTRTRP